MDRYNLKEISEALEVSTDCIRGYFKNRNQQLKEGLTMAQIVEFIDKNKFNRSSMEKPDARKVEEIRTVARLCGFFDREGEQECIF